MQLVVLASGLLAVACGLYLSIGGFGAVPRGSALSIVKPAWLALAGLGLAAVAFSAIWDWEGETIAQGSAQAGAGADDVVEATGDEETTSPTSTGDLDDEDHETADDDTTENEEGENEEDTTGTNVDACSERAVPNVIDDNVDDAISAIEANGLKADSGTAEGTDLVQDSDPPAGSSVCKGDTVELTICGSAVVPVVKGLSEKDALDELSAKGLDGEVVYEESETVDGGDVIRPEPGSGSVVCATDEVTIVVSEKPEVCDIPVVKNKGLTAASAREAIESASPHFSVVVVTDRVAKGTPGIGTITDQDKMGSVPCADTTITLTFTALQLEITNGGITTVPPVTSSPIKIEAG